MTTFFVTPSGAFFYAYDKIILNRIQGTVVFFSPDSSVESYEKTYMSLRCHLLEDKLWG